MYTSTGLISFEVFTGHEIFNSILIVFWAAEWKHNRPTGKLNGLAEEI